MSSKTVLIIGPETYNKCDDKFRREIIYLTTEFILRLLYRVGQKFLFLFFFLNHRNIRRELILLISN